MSALARGMKAIGSRLARAVNRIWGARGQCSRSASISECCGTPRGAAGARVRPTERAASRAAGACRSRDRSGVIGSLVRWLAAIATENWLDRRESPGGAPAHLAPPVRLAAPWMDRPGRGAGKVPGIVATRRQAGRRRVPAGPGPPTGAHSPNVRSRDAGRAAARGFRSTRTAESNSGARIRLARAHAPSAQYRRGWALGCAPELPKPVARQHRSHELLGRITPVWRLPNAPGSAPGEASSPRGEHMIISLTLRECQRAR